MFDYIYQKIACKIKKLIRSEVGSTGWCGENATGVYATLEQHRDMIEALAKHLDVELTYGDKVVATKIKKSKKK